MIVLSWKAVRDLLASKGRDMGRSIGVVGRCAESATTLAPAARPISSSSNASTGQLDMGITMLADQQWLAHRKRKSRYGWLALKMIRVDSTHDLVTAITYEFRNDLQGIPRSAR
jgi:hypothetical protein